MPTLQLNVMLIRGQRHAKVREQRALLADVDVVLLNGQDQDHMTAVARFTERLITYLSPKTYLTTHIRPKTCLILKICIKTCHKSILVVN